MSDRATDIVEAEEDILYRFGYILDEEIEGENMRTFYGYVSGETGYVEAAISFDNEQEIETAKQLWLSLTETKEIII
jgi:hypothetical protein